MANFGSSQDFDDKIEEEDSQKNKYLTFFAGDESYGVEIAYVNQIIGIQKITMLPDMPNFIKGIINLRGVVIPVFDLRLRFGMEEKEYGDRTCIIVLQFEEATFGLIVDTVAEVIDIPADSVDKPPKTGKGAKGKFIMGIGKVGKDVKILLDVKKILNEDEISEIKNL